MGFRKGDLVRFQGERYRVVKVMPGGRDLLIQDIDGNQMIVHPLTVQKGWQ